MLPRQSMKCVYCQKDYESLTIDHVFPLSWYPASTPKNIEKWKVPACTACNHEYGILEDDLKNRLILCFPKTDERIRGTGDKAMRGLKPEYGHSEKDRQARQRKRDKIKKGIIPAHKIPEGAALPGFGPINDIPLSDLYAIDISKKALFRFAEKLSRGFSYIFFGILIPDHYCIATYLIECTEFQDIMTKFGRHVARGPGIEIIYTKVEDDQFASAFTFEIWGRLRLYCLVLPKP